MVIFILITLLLLVLYPFYSMQNICTLLTLLAWLMFGQCVVSVLCHVCVMVWRILSPLCASRAGWEQVGHPSHAKDGFGVAVVQQDGLVELAVAAAR